MANSIAVFGGLFDPIHFGHLNVIETALNKLPIDKLYIVPSGIPPHKITPLFTANVRLSFLSALFEKDGRVVVSDIEINNLNVSYTIDTIRYFKEQFKDENIYFIIGADNISEIKTWRNPQKIIELANIIVAERPGYSQLDKFSEYRGKMKTMEIDPIDISSTEIRNKILAGDTIDHLVPKSVLEVIKNCIVSK